MDKKEYPLQNSIIKAFVDKWRTGKNVKTILYLRNSKFDIFSTIDFNETKISESTNGIDNAKKFDLIIGDFPLGMQKIEIETEEKKIRLPRNWGEIFKSLFFLNDLGTALFLLEPLGFSTKQGRIFEEELNKNGYYVSAFFNAPENILQPHTSITPIIAAITKTPTPKLFIAELLNEKQAEQVVDTYFSQKEGNALKTGKYIDSRSFHGFHRLKIKQQIERLETQYKNYSEYTLGELANEINYVKSGMKFKEKDNSIYVPKIGKSPVICKLAEAKLKHHNYFQVVLGELALNEYVSAFFMSTLGQLVLDSLSSYTFITHLNKRDLEQALVALPKLEEQNLIVNTRKTLIKMKKAIDEFEIELALNPKSSSSIQKQMDTMLDVIGGLTDIDKVYGLIREGESKHLEFKETLSIDVKKGIKEKYIETSALKTIVAFLNTDGGYLLIGITDNGTVKGLNEEIKKLYKNFDSFLLHLKNLIKDRIGEEYYNFIDYNVVKVSQKLVLFVECKASTNPCYLDQKDFYVRTNPATDKLEGPKLVEYVKIHFNR